MGGYKYLSRRYYNVRLFNFIRTRLQSHCRYHIHGSNSNGDLNGWLNGSFMAHFDGNRHDAQFNMLRGISCSSQRLFR